MNTAPPIQGSGEFNGTVKDCDKTTRRMPVPVESNAAACPRETKPASTETRTLAMMLTPICTSGTGLIGALRGSKDALRNTRPIPRNPPRSRPVTQRQRMSIVTGSFAAWRTSLLVSGIPTSRCWPFSAVGCVFKGQGYRRAGSAECVGVTVTDGWAGGISAPFLWSRNFFQPCGAGFNRMRAREEPVERANGDPLVLYRGLRGVAPANLTCRVRSKGSCGAPPDG